MLVIVVYCKALVKKTEWLWGRPNCFSWDLNRHLWLLPNVIQLRPYSSIYLYTYQESYMCFKISIAYKSCLIAEHYAVSHSRWLLDICAVMYSRTLNDSWQMKLCNTLTAWSHADDIQLSFGIPILKSDAAAIFQQVKAVLFRLYACCCHPSLVSWVTWRFCQSIICGVGHPNRTPKWTTFQATIIEDYLARCIAGKIRKLFLLT